MARSSKYWKDRFIMLQEAQLKKGEDYYKDLERLYTQTIRSLERDISVWYERFAGNNGISLSQAKLLLSGDNLDEFKWDVDEYIKYGKINSFNAKWMKELENASARVHLSRLEALKIQLQQSIERLYGSYLPGTEQLTKEVYSDGFYHTAFEIQSGFNVGYDLQKFNEKQLTQVISKPWAADGKTFSDRIWTSKETLINTLHTELTQALIRGDDPKKLINTISSKLKVDKNKAGRLVMTESAFFSSAAQKDAFSALNVEKYEIVATLDLRTSEICRELDGRVFLMKDFQPGITAPPFHVWCRTCTAPYFEDNSGERIARGANGKTYYVPSDIKFQEWYNKFIERAA